MKSVIAFQQQTGFKIPAQAQGLIESLMNQLKIHDIGTYEHCGRVSAMCLELAQSLNLQMLDQATSFYAGLLHDVGKINVPGSIINKPSKLTTDEYEIMKKHAEFGFEMLQPLQQLEFFQKVNEAVLNHHERIDGNGYHKVPSDKIPYISKIILVVDTVDAMSEDRAYRKGLPMNVIIDELVKCSGTQFDPHIVNVYLDSLERKKKQAA